MTRWPSISEAKEAATPRFVEQDGKYSRSRRIYPLLIAVLLIAAALRLAGLAWLPPGVEHDETAEALIAHGIWQGRHALFFSEAYGQEPLFLYLAAGALAIFGDHVLALRYVSAAVGLLSVAAGFRLARRLFGPTTGLITAAGLGVMLWPVFWSRVGLRGMTLPLFSSLAAEALWAAIRSRRPAVKRRRALWAGLLWGASAYTYLAARGLPIFLGLFGLYLALFNRAWLRRHGRLLALALLTALIVALPLTLYLAAHPEMQYRVGEVNAPLAELLQGRPGAVLANIPQVLAMFSLCGDQDVRNNFHSRPVFPEPVWAALFYVGLGVALARWRDPRYAFVLTWLAALLSPTLVTTEAPNFVRSLGALPVVMLLPGLGAQAIDAGVRKVTSWKLKVGNWKLEVAGVATCVLVIAFGLNLGLTFNDYFVRWPQLAETRFVWQSDLQAIAQAIEADPQARDVTLAGLSNASMDPASLALLTQRRDLAVRWIDTGSPLSAGGAIVIPAQGGRIFTPAIVPLNPLLAERLTAWGARRVDQAHFSRFDAPPPPVGTPPIASFETHLDLLDAGLPAAPCAAGQVITVVTTWQAGAPPYPPLKLFVHVLDAGGTLRAQHDGLDSPPAFWRAGDVLVQVHPIRLPDDLPAGSYTLRLGMYQPDTLQVYHLTEGADHFTIGIIQVE